MGTPANFKAPGKLKDPDKELDGYTLQTVSFQIIRLEGRLSLYLVPNTIRNIVMGNGALARSKVRQKKEWALPTTIKHSLEELDSGLHEYLSSQYLLLQVISLELE